MIPTTLTASTATGDAPGALRRSGTRPAGVRDLIAGLAPLVGAVPVAGPPVSAYAALGLLLLLVLVPPLALIATLVAVALVVTLALAAAAVLAVAVVKAAFLLVHVTGKLRPRHVGLPVLHVGRVKARRV